MATLAVIAATVGTATFLVPQIAKLLRTGDSAGVSMTWAVLGLVTNLGWLVYVTSQSLWAALLAPTLTSLSYGITVWAIRRTGQRGMGSFPKGGVWAILLTMVAWVGGWESLGVVLGLSYGVALAPSVVTAYRTAHPTGISPGTWSIAGVEAVLWGYYGLYHADPGIVSFAVLGSVGSALILVRYLLTRARHSPGVEHSQPV